MALWGGRFSGQSSSMFRTVNDSLPFDQILAEQDIQGSIAWSQAIARAGVISAEEQQTLQQALERLLIQAKNQTLDFAASDAEDIHSFVEAWLIDEIGDTGRKLHTGRSRNDQVATDLRLWSREQVHGLIDDLQNLQKALVQLAVRLPDAIIPGYTHLQRAQPVRFGHWCLAYVEMFKRDVSRLEDACNRMNQAPLGCGALAGGVYDIDRQQLAESLGFDGPCLNSLDAVSDRDFVLDMLAAASTGMMHLSRMAEDLIFYNSGEAGFLQLSDDVTSGSSLMPQKKNPDALELIRGKCGRVFGALQGLLVTMKGLPLAYNKDMQEDKEGLFDAMTQWHICLSIAVEVLDGLALNQEACRQAAQQGFANATELADYLVAKGVPFRTAHDLSGQAVLMAIEHQCALEDLSLNQLQTIHPDIDEDVYSVLDLDNLVDKRRFIGGTGKVAVEAAIKREQQRLGMD